MKFNYQKTFADYKDYINQLNEILSLLDLVCEGKNYKKLNKWYNEYGIDRYYINKSFDDDTWVEIGQLNYQEGDGEYSIDFKIKDDERIIKMFKGVI